MSKAIKESQMQFEEKSESYQEINSKVIDSWCDDGWECGQPITHQQYINAQNGEWEIYLSPTKIVPQEWFGELRGKKVLGFASGGGQLKAGFILTDLYEDTNGTGMLHEYNIPSFTITRAIK